MKKKALIFGVTGQDGSYLSELLLKKNYDVIGVMRRSSSFNTARIDHLYKLYPDKFDTSYGDLSDLNSIERNLEKFEPDEIYNLAAQSHVGVSFEISDSTFNINAFGPLNILQVLKNKGIKSKYYQACSSEMFGISPPPQNENTEFQPQSIYGVSKVSAYYTTRYYRQAFNMFAANGILFNHESPRRGLNFVTRKITIGIAKILTKEINFLELGNLSARRDWGFAGDYVEAIWNILQQDKPDDFVISTGENYSIEDFVREAFSIVGLDWKRFVKSNVSRYLRPSEVPSLLGDSSKAIKKLKWKPKVLFKDLCLMMVENDLKSFNLTLDEAKKIAKKL
tara:strand:- start:1391 stop:2401 length:1011 start_codon:yes stop_codon:yes gene_type:complete